MAALVTNKESRKPSRPPDADKAEHLGFRHTREARYLLSRVGNAFPCWPCLVLMTSAWKLRQALSTSRNAISKITLLDVAAVTDMSQMCILDELSVFD